MRPEEILTAAADKLEELLVGVTPGEWYADRDMGVYAYGEADQPDMPDVFKDLAVSYPDTQWIAHLGPVIGPNLIEHLRAAAAGMGACCMLECREHAALVKVAMQLVGFYGDPDSPHWDKGATVASPEPRSGDTSDLGGSK
jgi:hypothetical protein